VCASSPRQRSSTSATPQTRWAGGQARRGMACSAVCAARQQGRADGCECAVPVILWG
jgi:hypothetical protein